MRQIFVAVSEELVKVLERAVGNAHRGPWLEERLWTLKDVRKAAKELGIKNPKRKQDSRGKCENFEMPMQKIVRKREGKWGRVTIRLECGHEIVRRAGKVPSEFARCSECRKVKS